MTYHGNRRTVACPVRTDQILKCLSLNLGCGKPAVSHNQMSIQCHSIQSS